MAKDRLFSLYNVNGTITNPELAYPWRHEYIPIWLSGLLSVMVPILVYILMALRIRSFWDLNNAVCQALLKFIMDFLTSLDHGHGLRSSWCHYLPAYNQDTCRRLPSTFS
jgi:hypothetical protein